MKKHKTKSTFEFMKFLIIIIRIPFSIGAFKTYKINKSHMDYIYSKYDFQSLIKHCHPIHTFNVVKKVHEEGCLKHVRIRSDYKEQE